MAINTQKFLPSSKGGTLAKVNKTIIKSSSPIALSGKSLRDLSLIKVKVVEIDSILKGTLAAEKKKLTESKKQDSSKRREKVEEKLETKPKAESGKIKMPSLPRMGFLDWVKNFIGNVILGYFAVRLVDHLPKIIPIVKFLGKATDFVLGVGGKLLDGLVTFIDWGYKAYDATRGFVKNLFGNSEAKQFDQLSSALNQFLNLAIIAGMVVAGSGGGRGGKGRGGTAARPGKGGRPRVTTSGGGRNPLRRRPKVTTGRGGNRALLSSVRPFLKRIPLPIVGALVDFGLSVALGENPGRAAFRAIGAGLLGAVGAAAGTVVPVAGNFIGGLLGGVAGDAIGGVLYDFFFGSGMPSAKGKVVKKAGGGTTRGGRPQRGVKRTVSRKSRYRRRLTPQKPGDVEANSPGADVGGEKKLFDLFPDPFKMFQKAADVMNPFKVIQKAGQNLGDSDYFGPILSITSKILLGQKPTQQDYKNVGLGINMLVAKGIDDGKLKGGLAAFAEGGFVDPKTLDAISQGGDISDWVAKSFKDATETNSQKTLREIQENLRLKKGPDEQETQPGAAPPEGGGVETAGGAVAASQLYKEIGANSEQWDIFRNSIALIESTGKYGIPGGSGMHYDGRYQMGEDAKKDGSRVAGVSYPGHSSDPNAHVRVSFRNNPQLQETIFTGFTVANHRYLMRNPKYKSASVERKLQILGYAHNQGMGGAENWLTTGVVGADGFGTKGTKYTDLIAKNFKAKKSGGQMQLASGAVSGDKPMPMGKGYGSGGQKIAGDLGDFMKANRSKVPVTGDIHRHPRHLPWSKSGHSVGSLHYQGRAIDLGGWAPSNKNSGGRDEQAPVIKSIIDWNKKNGYSPVQLIHHSPKYKNVGWYQSDHNDHVHVAYEKGGFTKPHSHFAMLGEKGKEFVIDADSTAAIEQTFPGFLGAINRAKYTDAINVLSNFASYESGFEQTVMVADTPNTNMTSGYESNSYGGSVYVGGDEETDPFSILYQGG